MKEWEEKDCVGKGSRGGEGGITVL